MRETTPEINQLGRYWDDLVRGETADASELDPAMPEVIQHLSDLNRRVVPAPSFLNRIREDLMDVSIVVPGRAPHPLDELEHRRIRHGSAGRRPTLPARQERRLWAMTHLATAALLVLTLGSVFVSLGGTRLPIFAPTGIERGLVLETTLDSLPAGAETQLEVDRWVFTADPNGLTIQDRSGPTLVAVEQGTFVARADAATVLRAGAKSTSAETPSPGTEIALVPGDRLEIAAHSRFTIVGTGSVTGQLLTLFVGSGDEINGKPPYTPAVYNQQAITWSVVHWFGARALPAGPVNIVFEMLTLLPDADPPAETHSGLTSLAVDSGTLGLTVTGDHVPYPLKSGQERIYRGPTFGSQIPPLPQGASIDLRNAGDEPLHLSMLNARPRSNDVQEAGTPFPASVTGITSEPVFATTFPSEVLPKAGTAFVDLYLNTLQSDYEETVAPDPDDHGVNASIVLDGAWASKVEGPIRIVRADGAVEDVPPGVEMTLGPGDTSLQLDTKPGTTGHNPGSIPARVLGIEVRNPLNSSRFTTSGGIASTSTQIYPGDWLKEGSVAVTVRRVTVEPGVVLPPSDDSVWTARYVEAGAIKWKLTGAETATPRPERTYNSGKWVPATKAPAGQAIELRSGSDEQLVFLEVTIAPAAAETGVTSEPVYTVTFPDEATPDDGTYYVDLVIADWQPGVTSSAEARPNDDGPGVWFVMAGKLAVSSDGPLRVSRADGSVEEMTPRTEVLLAPGDAALWLDHGWGSSLRSAGDVPVRFLSMGLIERLDSTRFTGAIGTDTSMYLGDWLKKGPVVATLRRVTAAPGTTLQPSDPTGAATLYVESGTLTWEAVAAEDVATPLSPLPPRSYSAGSWVSWVNVSPQRKLIMSNTGDEPLVYLEVTIAPAGAETAALATAAPPPVAVDTMVETTIEGLTGGYANVWLERIGIAPGPATVFQGARPEPQVFAIETGTVVATVGGVEQTMSAGDSIVRPAGQELLLRNDGSTEATILFLSFYQVDATVFQYDSTDISEEVPFHYTTYALPDGPIHIVCERFTLPPGASLPYQPADLEWLGTGAGQVGVTLEGEGLPTAWDSGEERVFPALAALPVFSPDWKVTLRNSGDDPLILYRLSVNSTVATPTL